jgi:hypothetical protein
LGSKRVGEKHFLHGFLVSLRLNSGYAALNTDWKLEEEEGMET